MVGHFNLLFSMAPNEAYLLLKSIPFPLKLTALNDITLPKVKSRTSLFDKIAHNSNYFFLLFIYPSLLISNPCDPPLSPEFLVQYPCEPLFCLVFFQATFPTGVKIICKTNQTKYINNLPCKPSVVSNHP